MKIIEFNKDINCETCKYGYFVDYSSDGWHNLCGANNCYLCAEQSNYCNDYIKGDIPEGKKRIYEE